MEVHRSRSSDVGGLPVRRVLPWHGRRTVGAWCFLDHMGPAGAGPAAAMQVGPHPHIGLQTVTWLLEGAVLHTDSIGSEQLIRPGQLNLMTAGHGVSHAEAGQPRNATHGAQLWVALPEATRHGPPAFEHHAELPQVDLAGGSASVLLGELAGVGSPARADTPIVGADLAVTRRAEVPLEVDWEHAVVVLEGAAALAGERLEPGVLAYLAPGEDELVLDVAEPSRILLIGGEPFEAEPIIWWNFVGRSHDEVTVARDDWEAGHDRFGTVVSDLGRIPAPEVPWR